MLALVAVSCGTPGGDTTDGSSDSDEASENETSEASDDDDGDGDEAASASDEPINIGLLLPTSGVVAANGLETLEGWDLFWEQHGGVINGREVVSSHEDTAGDPNTGIQKLDVLLERENVHMVVGPLLANIGLAVGDRLSAEGVPHFSPVQCAAQMTQDLATPTFARIGGLACGQTTHPFADWAADQGYDEIMTSCTDFVFGHENCGGFADTFTDVGGDIVAQQWHPPGTQDFSTFINEIRDVGPDAVFAIAIGGDALRFLQTWNDFGMRDSGIELLMSFVPTDQSNLRNLDDLSIAEGLISAGHYAEGREEPGTVEFVEAFDERYGKLPAFYSAGGYTAAQWIAEALEMIDGDVEDTDAFMDAIHSVEIDDGALGPQRLDEFGNPDTNVYIRQLEMRDDGRLWNVVIDQFDMVSQFYTYDPEAYIEQEAYSRDFQGLETTLPAAN